MSPTAHQMGNWCDSRDKLVGSTHPCFYSAHLTKEQDLHIHCSCYTCIDGLLLGNKKPKALGLIPDSYPDVFSSSKLSDVDGVMSSMVL